MRSSIWEKSFKSLDYSQKKNPLAYSKLCTEVGSSGRLQNHHVIISLYEGGTPFAGIDAVASGGPPTARNMKKAEEAGTHACMYTHTQTIAPISHKWLLYYGRECHMMNMFPSSHFSFRPEESFLLQPGYDAAATISSSRLWRGLTKPDGEKRSKAFQVVFHRATSYVPRLDKLLVPFYLGDVCLVSYLAAELDSVFK